MRILALVILQLYLAEGFIPQRPKVKHFKSDGGDPGAPLFLTPYVEAGNITEGRRLARVTLPGVPDIESYTGFFTVNKTYNSNQFLWYIPAMKKNSSVESPVLLWLQGGPGGSSLYGLFKENGPFYVGNISNKLQFLPRQYHWAEDYHLIYIDNPVGAGFSFTNDTRGYCTDQTQVGEQLYTTLVQFFQLFPELQTSKFFITGESYAGKYIPALGYTIHKKNPLAEIKINLSGMFIGDGLCDPINQLVYHEYTNQLGLHSDHITQRIKTMECDIIDDIKKEQWLEASAGLYKLINFMQGYIGTISNYNYLDDGKIKDPDSDYAALITTSQIRKAIHVGNIEYDFVSEAVSEYLNADITKSVAPWITELLSYYRVIFYNGQLDIIVAYPLTVNFLRKLDFPESEQYSKADRYIVMVKESINYVPKLMGYAKGAGNMGEFMIRAAGHMVPKDQPLWAKYMLDFFIAPPPWLGTEDIRELKLGNNKTLITQKLSKI